MVNLIVDIDIILGSYAVARGKSGVFVVADNVIKRLAERPDLKISFSCTAPMFNFIKLLKKDDFYKKFEIVDYWKTTKIDDYFISKLNSSKISKKIAKTYLSLRQKIYIKKQHFNRNDSFAYLSILCKPHAFLLKNIPNVTKFTILHDAVHALFPQWSPGMNNGKYWFAQLIKTLNGNDFYFTVSQNTKKDFLKLVPSMNSNHIFVNYIAADPKKFYPCNDEKKILNTLNKYKIPSQNYILSLCTLDYRKNILFAVKNFIAFIKKNKIDNLYLVLAGGQRDDFMEKLEESFKEFTDYRNKIIITGYIADEDLAPLYSAAIFFVYPTIYEGFGLPPLEAMQCGCPVITSNNSSLPEVCGDSAILIDCYNDNQLQGAYFELYTNKEKRLNLSKKGLERCKLFNWEKTATFIGDTIMNYAKK